MFFIFLSALYRWALANIYEVNGLPRSDRKIFTDISFFLDHIKDSSTVRTNVLKDKFMMISTRMSFDLEANPQTCYACNQRRISAWA